MTGQVTGLGRFRGNVGYLAPDELHMRMGTAALSDFRRASVGLSDVLLGVPYQAAPYYDRSSTALSARPTR